MLNLLDYIVKFENSKQLPEKMYLFYMKVSKT